MKLLASSRMSVLVSALFFSCAAAAEAPSQPATSEQATAKSQAAISEQVSITEWTVPWEKSLPRDPWVGSQGTIWFVGQNSDYVATLDPTNGEFKQYPLDDNAGPHTVIADKRGAWYAGNRSQHIGLVNPETGAIEKFMLPGEGPRDVHTMDFARNGDIWFTVQGGNQIGVLKAASKHIKLFDVPTKNARPYGLLVDKDDKPWVTLFGTNKLATIEDNKVVEITLPRAENRPRRLAITPDGMVWYVDYAEGHLGRYNPTTGAIDEWRTPAQEKSRPYAVAADKQGHVWFFETGVHPNRLVSFDPASNKFSVPVELESGGGTVRHMVYDEKENALWFGTDTNTIGRAQLP